MQELQSISANFPLLEQPSVGSSRNKIAHMVQGGLRELPASAAAQTRKVALACQPQDPEPRVEEP
jgi:hypothetical protein